jgi:glycosyltransferase involved in cell wall biosynthesis
MKVGFNARLLSAPTIRGWNRYTVELLAELARLGVDLVLYSQDPVHPAHLGRIPPERLTLRHRPGLKLLAWEHRWLPAQCALDGVDLLHAPFNMGLPWSSPCPRVLTLHDAIYQEELRSLGLRGRWRGDVPKVRLLHRIARVRAHRVLTVSEHARSELIANLGIPARKVAVTPEAADDRFHRAVPEADRLRVRRAHDLPDRYLFYIGGWEGRKNVPYLLRALAQVPGDLPLVLAGGRPAEKAALTALAASLGLADRVRFLGWVEDDDLPALYAEALAFAYPSRYEGFGLQLCEAMAAGCPTLAARATSLPEVLGPGGETFPLDDPAHLAGLIRRVDSDPAFRADLSARALRRSADFSWRKTAERTLEEYETALRLRGQPGA